MRLCEGEAQGEDNMAIKFSAVKITKVARLGGGKSLTPRLKTDFIFRVRSAYKKDSIGQAHFKTLMEVAKFKGVENRTAGENGVLYMGDRSKILADLDAQIEATTNEEELKALKEQKEFLSQFNGDKFWEITAKDMEADENLQMLLDINTNNCL